MSWEMRRGRRYYYRAFRRNGRVVKRYIGAGVVGEAAAKEDAARRAELTAQRQAEQQRRQADLTIGRQVQAANADSDALLEAALLAAGFHRPQRKAWRRRRSRRNQDGITAKEG